VMVGLLCTALALLACWLARESRALGFVVLLLLAVAWVMPGPVVGLGLKGVLRAVLDAAGWPALLAPPVWCGPSARPVGVGPTIRLLPFGAGAGGPVVRLLPREPFEAGRLDGAAPRHELLRIVWPAAARAARVAVLTVALLSLGELAGAKMVS